MKDQSSLKLWQLVYAALMLKLLKGNMAGPLPVNHILFWAMNHWDV